MKIKVTKQINATTSAEFLIEGTDLRDTLLKATPFLTLPDSCGECQSKDIVLEARVSKDKQYIFPQVSCTRCKARMAFGEYKGLNSTFFLKQWEVYEPKEQAE
jgi:hypothetical protein